MTEYVRGTPLPTILDGRSTGEIDALLPRLYTSLDEMHRLGVVHRCVIPRKCIIRKKTGDPAWHGFMHSEILDGALNEYLKDADIDNVSDFLIKSLK
jgi:hypothetical protein